MPPVGASRHDRRGAGRSPSFRTRLPHDGAAASAARRLLRMRLGHAIARDTLDDLMLVVSELVTNAVLHGRGDIRLRIDFDGQTVTGDVCDGGCGFAHSSPTRPSTGIGGNGLHLVETVTQRWGVAEGSSRVWFELANRSMATAGA